ncbi:hypothetical protein LW135_07290 [Helicobacter sp. faydin-H20]|uniref:hypothetical protein n=1 Tax=Helicobacter anatolicus TaxID=2905874 RepID=UPI001E31179E|nr:hypothetical protein [Helicobacter anatolicus]MCE3037624.1 hypothetical protein [Helicobacter anatolicus]
MSKIQKGIKKIFLVLCFACFAYAENTAPNLVNIMLNFEKEMSLIQEAFLKNSQTLVEVRQRRLKNLSDQLREIPTSFYLDKKTHKFQNLIDLRIMRIDEELEAMGKALKRKDMDFAFQNYLNILNECNSCHILFRR